MWRRFWRRKDVEVACLQTSAYTPAIYQQKCAALFEHIFESYPEWPTRVYAQAA
jgi:hypothetical protein